MKILFVAPYVPSLVRVRSYNFIRSLSRLGHQVTVLTISSSHDDRAGIEDLGNYCDEVVSIPLPKWRSLVNCVFAIPGRMPLQAVYSWSPAFAETLSKLGRWQDGKPRFDIVHFEHLRSARYSLYLKTALDQTGIYQPIVWDSVDCISHLFRQASTQRNSLPGRLLTRFELPRTERFEKTMMSQITHILVTSALDKRALGALAGNGFPRPVISVVPQGVDLDYFKPGDAAQKEELKLVISGKMSYHANVSMVMHLIKNIMPLVWEKQPEVKLDIVGKNPPREIMALDHNQQISVTGFVPDIRPYLQQAAVAVVPLTYGAGIQNKILEAMACGTAVITSPRAVSALVVESGKEVVVAKNATDFADGILDLLKDTQKRDRMAQAGLRYVQTNHRWSSIAQKLEEVYSYAKSHPAGPE